MTLLRLIFSCLFIALFASVHPVSAQETAPEPVDRSATGGAQTLEDILARQRGEAVDDTFRRENTGNPLENNNLSAPLGGVSDPEIWRALRYGTADVSSTSQTPGSTLLVQDGGMAWLKWRQGPLLTYGGYALLIMLGLLVLFYLLRGKIMIEAGPSDTRIERFKPVERFGHWLLAGSFILLGLTGLITLFGRKGLIPWMGHDTYATIALAGKWIHNNVAWAFMLGLIMVFVMWVARNIPHRRDLVWIIKAGGLLSKHSHPPAGKFNAGQKLIFWGTIVLGASISVSGLALLFPFEIPMFAKTFGILNSLGAPGWVGMAPLPEVLTPHQEMQFAQGWHAIMAFAMMVMIIAHIYIGSVGMEGAFDAMGDGQVDLNWAKEHHSVWVEEVQSKASRSGASTPAE